MADSGRTSYDAELPQIVESLLAAGRGPTDQEMSPGLCYGLGIFWAPNRCGGYWGHPATRRLSMPGRWCSLRKQSIR